MFDGTSAEVDPEVAELVAQLERLAAVDVTGADEQVLCDTAVALEHARRFLDAAQCHALAELDARSVTDRAFGLHTGAWLAREASLPSSVARQHVRTASQLRRVLPGVDAALTQGRITLHHARVLADASNPRIEAGFDAVAAHLCDAVEGVTFDRWRREAQGLADLMDADGGHRPTPQRPSRLRFRGVGDSVSVDGELSAEHFVIAEAVLNEIADELYRQHARDQEQFPELVMPSRATLLAEAFVEACRRAIATDLTTSRRPHAEATFVITPDGIDAHSRFHQALADLGLGPGSSGSESSGSDGSGLADRPDRACSAGMTITDTHGTLHRADRLACLLCDADLHPLIVDGRGVPLHLGRTVRLVTAGQRRALTIRDGGCTFPGCEAPPDWCDAHHVLEWLRGGRTDVSALLSLCRRHHGVAHRTGWSVVLDDDGWSRWTSPSGVTRWGQRHHRQRAGPAPAPS